MNTIFPDGFAIMVITLLVLPALAIPAFCRKELLECGYELLQFLGFNHFRSLIWSQRPR